MGTIIKAGFIRPLIQYKTGEMGLDGKAQLNLTQKNSTQLNKGRNCPFLNTMGGREL